MSVTDELLEHNARYAEDFSGPLPLPPAKHVVVLACMDARLDVYRILGLAEGEAHVIQGLAEQNEYLLVFDDGNFDTAGTTFNVDDWIAHTPKDILAKSLGKSCRINSINGR